MIKKKFYYDYRNEIKEALSFFIDGANCDFEFFKEFHDDVNRDAIFKDKGLLQLYYKLSGICSFLDSLKYCYGTNMDGLVPVTFSCDINPDCGFTVEAHIRSDGRSRCIDHFC